MTAGLTFENLYQQQRPIGALLSALKGARKARQLKQNVTLPSQGTDTPKNE